MNFAERFQQLDAWLAAHQKLWRAKPFIEHQCTWENQWPELATWLRKRSLEQAEQAHTQPHLIHAPAPFGELARTAIAFTQVPDWSSQSCDVFPEPLQRHIPGRKWQQIIRFAQASQTRWQQPTRHWVDWCAGKGHLGRLMAWQGGQSLLCLEQNAQLNRDGEKLSESFLLHARHQDADVLSPSAWHYLAPEQSLVALHACGQLHMTLLQRVAARGCAQVALAPCCYNRIEGMDYMPLSEIAQRAKLKLSKDDLGLPMQESVTAGQRTRRLRDCSMAWRLAFDLWQREAQGSDHYLPTPSRPESAMSQGIAAFCRELASYHNLHLPEPASWPELEQRGWQRLAEVRNLELVRGLFRRPLEMWLLLDRALFMQEAGYRVEIGLFCPAELTPRNFLLIAELPCAQAITRL
ncbi:methyltransferase [uncultured Halopseudomonas sp.]|uniref:methyltransferase n=1 Tax=uncultured Halopseudomonas sp. TaxID=2901193 RepID=UPI0030EBE89B|tara:strand:- start:292 stop:1515 length:1224 start_codon:yes stop_codon:yes gene_type:complete